MDGDHRRIEARRYYATGDIEWLRNKSDWEGLQSIAMVESERRVGEQTSIKRRYYVSSLEADAKQLGRSIRGRWSVENSLHRVLDVGFRENTSRIRKDNGPENMATLRHIASNLLKQERTLKGRNKVEETESGVG